MIVQGIANIDLKTTKNNPYKVWEVLSVTENLSKPNLLATSFCVRNRQVWFIQVKLTKIFFLGILYRIPVYLRYIGFDRFHYFGCLKTLL